MEQRPDGSSSSGGDSVPSHADVKLSWITTQKTADARVAWEERTLAFLEKGGAQLPNGTPISRIVLLQKALQKAEVEGKPLDDQCVTR